MRIRVQYVEMIGLWPQLQAAVEEAEKNASLINEYHELYELQRKRLEKQLGETGDERELWSTTAYSLAVKVSITTTASTTRSVLYCT